MHFSQLIFVRTRSTIIALVFVLFFIIFLLYSLTSHFVVDKMITVKKQDDSQQQMLQYNSQQSLHDTEQQAPQNYPVGRSSTGIHTDAELFTVTAYDLSVQSCGKPVGSKGYGVTATGLSITGKSWHEARVVAVDPKVIPLKSKVELKFVDPNFSKYNGIYTAADTGSAIVGKKIDLFLGDFNSNKPHPVVFDFGIRKAYVRVIR